MRRSRKTYDTRAGLANGPNARDLPVGYVADVKNMVFDKPGVVRSMGQLIASTVTATAGTEPLARNGLFVFGADRQMGTKSISAVADNGGGNTRYTVTGHGLRSGDYVFHYGCADSAYNGAKVSIGYVDANRYDTTDVYTATDTGTAVTGTASTVTFEYYIAMAANNALDVTIIPATLNKALIDLRSDIVTGDTDIVFYWADGALHIYRANPNDTDGLQSWWFGYIDRTHFPGLTDHEEVYDKWYAKDAFLTAPTRGLAGGYLDEACTTGGGASTTVLESTEAAAFTNMSTEVGDAVTDGEHYLAVSTTASEVARVTAHTSNTQLTTDALSASWDSDNYQIYPPEGGLGFNVATSIVGVSFSATGGWEAMTLEFATTFVYDGVQESLPFQCGGTYAVSANEVVPITIFATEGYDPRISGGKVYCRRTVSGDDWRWVGDIDMDLGYRAHDSSIWSPWVSAGSINAVAGGASDSVYIKAGGSLVYNLLWSYPSITYEALNGHSSGVATINAVADDITVANRRAFGCNVKNVDKSDNVKYFGDRIYYTPVNCFDKWPDSQYLDVARHDGDEFTGVESYADRLLCFKNRKLYVINVSQGLAEAWFVESEYTNRGIGHRHHKFKAEEGVFWANENGCFFFGPDNSVMNLLERNIDGQMVHTIDDVLWSSFWTDNGTVGFNPTTKTLIVIGDTTATAGDCYLYNVSTGAWTKGDRFKQDSDHKYTNFAVHDNDLVIGEYTD